MTSLAGLVISSTTALVLEEAAGVVQPVRRPGPMFRTALELKLLVWVIGDALLKVSSPAWVGNEAAISLIKKVEPLIYDAEDCLREYSILGRRRGAWGALRFFMGPGGPFFAFSVMRQMHSINVKLRRWLLDDFQPLISIRGGAAACGDEDVGISSPARPLRISDSIRRGDGRLQASVTVGLHDEYKILGMDAPKLRLLQLLLHEGGSDLSVIAVVGKAGIGKTTLTHSVYNDSSVSETFDLRFWVPVEQLGSDDHMLKKQLLRHLLWHVRDLAPQPDAVEGLEYLETAVRSHLKDRRYVVVLDDVRDADAWEAIKSVFPDDKTGSRILVTSRSEQIASSLSGRKRGYIYRLGPLSSEDSWNLFLRYAFSSQASGQHGINYVPPEAEKVAREIVEQSRGLPLAIKMMGHLMSEIPPSEWNEFLNNNNNNESNDHHVRMAPGDVKIQWFLQSSYSRLTPQVQRCLLYLSIYPPDYKIRRGHLLRLWAAEGLVAEHNGSTTAEVAETHLNELIESGMVDALDFDVAGRARSLAIHKLIRRFIVAKASEENFVALSCEEGAVRSRKIRRMSIIDGGIYIPPAGRLSRLWTLITFDQQKPLIMASWLKPTCFARLRLLKVLDLEGAELWEFPSGIMRLRLLVYLSLKDTHIPSLPSSIGGLEHLETLDLRGTRVRKLPDDIVRLKKLRHLLAAYCKAYACQNLYQRPVDVEAPVAGMRHLTDLEKLSGIRITNTVVDDLGELTGLRSLALTGLADEYTTMSLCLSMGKLGDLRSLVVHSVPAGEPLDLSYMNNSPPMHLEKLHLDGPVTELPRWIASLQSLVKIVLQRSRMMGEDPLKSLQRLPNLQQLELWHDAYTGDHLFFGEEGTGGFQSLRILELRYMFGLEMVTIRAGTMTSLEKLVIDRCTKLKQMPLGLEHLTALRDVDHVQS